MAKRSGFDGVFLDGTTGLPLIGLDIAVYNSSGSTLSTIYTTKEGDTIKTNPFQTTSGNSGLVQFWAAPGYYEIEVSDSLSRISTRRIPFDAVAGDTTLGDEGISLDQIPEITTAKIDDEAVTNDKIADDAVDTAQIADGAVTNAKVTLTHETGTITYNAGYSASSSTETGPLTITKNAEGMVFISGGITRTSSFSVGGIVGTLPEGFRPAAPILLWAVNPVTGVTTSLQLLANGQLKTLYSSSTASGTSVIATSFYAA